MRQSVRFLWAVKSPSLLMTSPFTDQFSHLWTIPFSRVMSLPFVSWIDSSLLSLQPAKCYQILISRKKNSNLPPPAITVGGTPLTTVSSVRYLGLQIRSDLSWSTHVANLCIKARRLIGLRPSIPTVWQTC